MFGCLAFWRTHLFLHSFVIDCEPLNQWNGSVFVPVECHLCYNKTKSTPGFAADPNTCQRFVMCEPDGMGGWNTFNMTCPKCTFWNQELLTCVQVDFGPGCSQTHVTDYLNYTTPSKYTFSMQTFSNVSTTYSFVSEVFNRTMFLCMHVKVNSRSLLIKITTKGNNYNGSK